MATYEEPQSKSEDIAKAFQMGLAIGFGERYDELDRVIDEIKKVIAQKTGQWIRMSDLSEKEDDRYKCSHCGNVVHYKNKMDLYTFNSWCGRCGSNNGRKIEVDI